MHIHGIRPYMYMYIFVEYYMYVYIRVIAFKCSLNAFTLDLASQNRTHTSLVCKGMARDMHNECLFLKKNRRPRRCVIL
jgi:hypothetical protein